MFRFEIYWLHGGTFKREGDGGYLNVRERYRHRPTVANSLLIISLVGLYRTCDRIARWYRAHVYVDSKQ